MKTKEEFGGLSNMAAGYPLLLNSVEIRTFKALYQACRFSHLLQVQKNILEQASPMSVKMQSRAQTQASRTD